MAEGGIVKFCTPVGPRSISLVTPGRIPGNIWLAGGRISYIPPKVCHSCCHYSKTKPHEIDACRHCSPAR